MVFKRSRTDHTRREAREDGLAFWIHKDWFESLATPNQNVPESELSRIRTVPNQNRVLNQNCSYQNCPGSELSGIRTVPKQNCSYQNCPESELSCIRTVPNQNCPEAELFVSELPQIRIILYKF
uniref:Uncharacterized protein n=1 Tax=Caenorhabditis japonica TaxID=281687 RepID=A0A8R1EK87_CAEJA